MDHPFDSKILIPTLPQGTEDVCQVAIAALQKARWSIPVSYLNVAILALESKFTPRTADEFFLPSGEADTSRRVIKHLLSAYITRFALYQSMDDFDSCVSIWSVILKKASCPGDHQIFPGQVGTQQDPTLAQAENLISLCHKSIDLEQLQEACLLIRRALLSSATHGPTKETKRAEMLYALAQAQLLVILKGGRSNAGELLTDAAYYLREAISLVPKDYYNPRHSYVYGLCTVLGVRISFGEIFDLSNYPQIIALVDDSVQQDITESNAQSSGLVRYTHDSAHPRHIPSICAQFRQLEANDPDALIPRQNQDLNVYITTFRQALDTSGPQHPRRADLHRALAILLSNTIMNPTSLHPTVQLTQDCIDAGKEALLAWPDTVNEGMCDAPLFSALLTAHLRRFHHTGQLNFLNDAISYGRRGLAYATAKQLGSLNMALAVAHFTGYCNGRDAGDMSDLDEAIEFFERGLRSTGRELDFRGARWLGMAAKFFPKLVYPCVLPWDDSELGYRVVYDQDDSSLVLNTDDQDFDVQLKRLADLLCALDGRSGGMQLTAQLFGWYTSFKNSFPATVRWIGLLDALAMFAWGIFMKDSRAWDFRRALKFRAEDAFNHHRQMIERREEERLEYEALQR